jgi:hypothetical protein
VTIVTSPPELPQIAEEQLLFREARQRRRRRWLVAGIVLVIVAAGIVVALMIPGAKTPIRPPASPPPPTPIRPVGGGAAIPQIAWVDYNGQLHIGDLSGFTQRVVAQADADPTAPLVTAGGRVFWVRSQQPNPDGSETPLPNSAVFGFDTATGRTERIASGTQVMASADRTFIYVETDYRHLTEYWLDGTPKGRTLPLPNGWYALNPDLNGGPTPVLANGIVVASWPVAEKNRTLGIWNPSTGRVRILGKVWQVTATYTAPGARSSLIAWNPASCATSESCTLKITNTANYSSRIVASPTGRFLWGGGFSPDGSQLAAFVSSGAIHGDPTAQLAIVSTRSGAVKLVKDVNVYIGDAVAWADWLPDGRHLITGGLTPFGSTVPAVDVLVDSQTDQASPFRFLADRDQDLAMSTVVVP